MNAMNTSDTLLVLYLASMALCMYDYEHVTA